jgi:hypothetical protein
MSRNWRWFLIGYVWSLPLVLLFLPVVVAIYSAGSWVWHDGVLTCVAAKNDDGTTKIWGRPGAQTWGWVTVFASEAERQDAALRVHERCHTVQAFVLGILWLLIYGIMFIVPYLRAPKAGWKAAYEKIAFEVWAYARQAVSKTDHPQPSWRWGALPLVVSGKTAA